MMPGKSDQAKKFTRFEAVLVILLIGSIGFAIKTAVSMRTVMQQDDSADPVLEDRGPYGDEPADDGDSLFHELDEDKPADEDNPAIMYLKGVTNRPAPGSVGGSYSRTNTEDPQPAAGQNIAEDGSDSSAQYTSEAYAAQTQGNAETIGTGNRKIPGVLEHEIVAPPQVMDILEQLAGKEWSRDSEEMLIQSIQEWASVDMQSALEFALTIDKRGAREAAMNDALSTWLNNAPQDAEKWFIKKTVDEPFLMGGLVNQFFASYAERAPDQALKAVWEVSDVGMRRAALQSVAKQCMEMNRESDILGLYDTVKSSQDKKLVIDAIMQNMAKYEPLALGQWALSITDKSQRSLAMNSLVYNWAKDCPSEAAAWVASNVTKDEGRSKQLAYVAQAWANEDPIEAGDWLLTLFPPSKDTDAAVDNFARSVLRVDPSYASEWATAVTSQKMRWRLMEQIAWTWRKSNPAAAKAYVMQTDLPQKTKARLLR